MVFVRNGTYYENVIVNKTISLMGEDQHFAVVNGSISVTADDVQVSGFHVTFGATGIYIDAADQTVVVGNLIDHNQVGVRIDFANQTVVSNNTIDNNYYSGISLNWSFNDTITGNTISNTTGSRSSVGVYAYYSNDSLIYHNNFIHNIWAPLAIVQSFNKWDDGYPVGGNYWGPWAYPSDVFKGPYQNETDSDGIIDGYFWQILGIIDNYPLAKPWPWGPHDVGVTFVGQVFAGVIVPLKTIVGQGLNLPFSVFVMNYGTYSEIASVSVYANDTNGNNSVVTTLSSVALQAKDSVILNFIWNTAGFAKANYTVTAIVDQVSGETDTGDNTLVGGSITVARIGDITGITPFVPDGKVDIRDIALVASSFGSTPGDLRWNANCDVNNDGKVDIRDIAIVAKHFGQAQ
jgi:parallel beta-helix repeat protein